LWGGSLNGLNSIVLFQPRGYDEHAVCGIVSFDLVDEPPS
jgi:hypothetical protein